MDVEKRSLIVKEIDLWRRNKLLPEHLCDFLLNLYGDEPSRKAASNVLGVPVNIIRNGKPWMWLLTISVLIGIMFAVINFHNLALGWQIALSAFFVVCLGTASIFIGRKVGYAIAAVAHSAAPMLFLLLGLVILRGQEVHVESVYSFWLFMSGLIWLIIGCLGSYGFLQYCGWMLQAIAYAGLLSSHLNDSPWYVWQIAWLPLSALFVWLGWLVRGKYKSSARAMLMAGLSFAFMPELSRLTVSIGMVPAFMQGLLFGKAAIAAMGLFALRKTWTDWIV